MDFSDYIRCPSHGHGQIRYMAAANSWEGLPAHSLAAENAGGSRVKLLCGECPRGDACPFLDL